MSFNFQMFLSPIETSDSTAAAFEGDSAPPINSPMVSHTAMTTTEEQNSIYRTVKVFDLRVPFQDNSEAEAAQIVWSSQSVIWAMEAFERGLPVKASPFFAKNPSLRRANK